jgi:membrane protein
MRKQMRKVGFVLRQLPERVRAHNLTLVGAGVAFYAFLAFIPTLIAVVSVYGLVATPTDVERQVDDFASALPDEVEDFIKFQLTSVVEASDTGVSITLVVSVAVALWSASGGMAALITGLHVAQEQEEPKSFVVKRGKAVALTLGSVLLLAMVVFIVAVLPGLAADFGDSGRLSLSVVRWPVLLLVMIVGVGALYRLSVSEARPGRFGIITVGTLTGAVLWVLASALFGIYTANFSRYSETYGSLATIVVLLFWLYLSALAILLGSEVDAITR